MKYQQRAEKFYAAAPSNAKLRTLIRLDLEERGQWTHRFATHVGMSLGAVIKEVMTEREAICVVSQHQLAPPEPKSAPSASSNPSSSTVLGKNIVGELRDGTPFAVRFSADSAHLLGGLVMVDGTGAGTC